MVFIWNIPLSPALIIGYRIRWKKIKPKICDKTVGIQISIGLFRKSWMDGIR
jgi:hypothetical protein